MSFFIVGQHMGVEAPVRLAICDDADQAAKYIGDNLPDPEDGRYYIDGPIVGPLTIGEAVEYVND